MKYRLLVIANLGFIIGIIMGLYFKEGIILFLSIFVVGCILYLNYKRFTRYFLKLIDNKKISYLYYEKFIKLKKFIYKMCRYLKIYITKKVLIVFLLFFILGYLLLICKEIKYEKFIQDMSFFEQSGSISGYAVIVSDKEEKEYSNVYKIKVVSVNNRNYSNTYCFINIKKQNEKELKYGDLIYFEGEFLEPQDRTNFKGYSYKEYLKTINVYGTFKTTYNKVHVLEEKNMGFLYLLANKVKNSFKRSDR